MKTKIMAVVLAILMLLPAVMTACEPADDGGTGSTESGSSTNTPEPGDSSDAFNGFVLTATGEDKYDISENLFGIFLEDINHAVDGGLYAEEIFNRSFEYGDLAKAGGEQGWSKDKSSVVELSVVDGTSDKSYLNEQNPHYARVTNTVDGETHGIYNRGFYNDLYIEGGEKYTFSVYARGVDGYAGSIYISVETMSGTVYATGTIDSVTGEWHKYEMTLEPEKTASSNVRLVLRLDRGTVDLDMISLIPEDTYEGSKNGKYGIRRDLAEMLEDLTPRFFRFPGGCIIEGMTLDGAYDWKDSIGRGLEFTVNGEKTVGDVATRPICENIWADYKNKQDDAYYMTYGLGFYEYMMFCEDLGCEPIPVLNCGYSCQGKDHPSGPEPGTPEFQRYVDDALDFIEFCRGGADTEWGSVRIAMGHEEPFHLTYLGIGNEQFGYEYNRRYAKFREALINAEKEDPDMYGGIKLIMANGLTSGSRDGWDAVASSGKDLAFALDEHYYNPPEWFILSELRYDFYDRTNPKVFIGEYASKSNLAGSAIAEAAYLTSVERNGDVVELATYAPLFAYDKHTQWAPNLIWYNAKNVWGSTNYYVQKIYANNQPSKIIPSELDGSGFTSGGKLSGRIGLGTWVTSAQFDDLVVTDTKTGDVIYEDDFSKNNLSKYTVSSGSFAVNDGKLQQSNTAYPQNADTGDVIYIGEKNWSNYTVTFKAKKLSGGEGFIIPFAVSDKTEFWHWNIGGWGNTVSTVEYAFKDGAGVYKSGQLPGTTKNFKVEANHEYEIKIVLDGYNMKGYIDGELMFDFDAPQERALFSVIGEDDNDIIVKLVNTSNRRTPVKVDLSAVSNYEGEAKTQFIKFHSADANNVETETEVLIEEGTLNVKSVFEYELDKLTMIVIRIPKK